MSLLEEIDRARARALARYQRETGVLPADAPLPTAPIAPQPSPRIRLLLRLPLLLLAVAIPLLIVLGLLGYDLAEISWPIARGILAVSTVGLVVTILAAFGRLPERLAGAWRPARSSLPLRILVTALLWLGALIELPWLGLLLPILLLRRILPLVNAASLRAMEEKELLRLRAGLAPTPPISGPTDSTLTT